MTSAARAAWNEAMKATAGVAALPPALAGGMAKRRSSDRNKKGGNNTHRKKRKTTAAASLDQDDEYAMDVWIDALEGVDSSSLGAELGDDKDDDDAFDELEDLEEGQKKGNRRKKKRKASGGSGGASAATMPKRFWPRTLASILTEEHGRVDSTAPAFLESHAVLSSSSPTTNTTTTTAPAPTQQQRLLVPRRLYCPVTGLPAIYKDPSTGSMPYATLSALAQIRERPPPWQTLSGAAAFAEAQRSILE